MFLDEKILKIINDYIRQTADPETPVTKHLPPQELRRHLDLSLPAEGCTREDLYRAIDAYLEFGVRTGHKQFFNQLWSGFTLPGFLGEIFTCLTNTSMYTYEVAPVATLMELELLKKAGSLAGFKDPEGLFVTGGSNGNLLAMLIARNKILPGIKEKGFSAPNNLVAFVSDQAHYSFNKAANVLGIGSDQVIPVKSDASGRMIPGELKRSVAASREAGKLPFFVAVTAGTTVTGAFDPCDRIGPIARENQMWLHVDGSLGGTVLLSPRHRSLLQGLAEADSFVWNPHKLMGLPLICSIFLTREKDYLVKTNAVSGAEYLFHDESYGAYDLGPISLQCGRKVDALKLWLSWKYYGDSGYAERIDRFFELAAYAEEIVIQHSDLELLVPRSSVNICFRYLPPEGTDINVFNLKIREELARSGKSFVNFAYIDDKLVLRPVIANHELEKKDIDTFFKNVILAAKGLLT